MRLRDRAHAEIQAQHLGQQISHLALGEVVLRAQHTDECQRPRPRAELPARHARRKWCTAGLAARRAAPAVQAVLADLRTHHGNIKNLMTHGFACEHHRGVALVDLRGGAVDDPVDLGFVHQRAVTAGVTFCAPRLRGLARRCARLGLPGPSEDGGLDDVLEFSVTRSCSQAISCCCSATNCTSVSITSWHCARVGGLGASTPGASSATGSVVCMAVVLQLHSEIARPTL